jgi:hypothetical protein
MTSPRTAVHPAGARRRRPAAKARRRRPAGRRRRKSADLRRLWPALLLVVAVLAGLAWDTDDSSGLCTMPGTSITLTPEQLTNAATIADVGRSRGLSERAVVIALATAQQESRLRNLDYGDRDSLGLFQQRPSQGWGTPAQVQDPVYAAGKFYDRLVEVPDWSTRPLTEVAQSVQKSGFPDAYAQWETMAEELSAMVSSNHQTLPSCR